MIRIVLPFALLTTSLVLTLPAHATPLTRTFVSSAGLDSNPCTITQPCATFGHAYSLTAPNGIIAALDPGRYGGLTITGPITINGYGWAAITGPAQNDAIIVNASTTNGDIVTLNGLEIDGAGAGYNGIHFNSGGKFTVTNCVLENFFYTGAFITGNGILIAPNSGGTFNFDINNSVVANNGNNGIYYFPLASTFPTTNGIVDHVATNGNQQGMNFDTSDSGGTTNIAVSNSVASNNGVDGIEMAPNGATMTVAIDNTVLSGNVFSGISAFQSVHVLLGRSVITGNGNGIQNQTSPNTFYSYGDNRINGNTTADVATGTGLSSPVTIAPQ